MKPPTELLTLLEQYHRAAQSNELIAKRYQSAVAGIEADMAQTNTMRRRIDD